MDNKDYIEYIDNPVDIDINKPSRAKFLFHLGLFSLLSVSYTHLRAHETG
jgi:hypothetical protein